MANRERGEVSFDASGKTWALKLDTNAMCEIEAIAGKGMPEVAKLLGDEQTASLTLMRAVFCGMLQAHHEGLSVKRAGELMDEVGHDRAGVLIGEAFELASPKADARPQKAAKAA